MVAAKEWTKRYPKDDKIISLTTFLSKWYKEKTIILATVQGGEANKTQDFPILNTGESRNQETRLLEMAKIGDGSPSTTWVENLMECAWTTQPINMKSDRRKTEE